MLITPVFSSDIQRDIGIILDYAKKIVRKR
jgi:hypothetical protein